MAKMGHFATQCRTAKQPVKQPKNRQSPTSAAVISTIAASRAPRVKVTVDGSLVIDALPDTGADISVAGIDVLQHVEHSWAFNGIQGNWEGV